MIGSLLLGGKTYTVKQYISVLAIIAGTVTVGINSGKDKGTEDSVMGLIFISLSLFMDGVTAGMQDRIKQVSKDRGVKAKPFELMFSTNVVMCTVALALAFFMKEFNTGLSFIKANPEILSKIAQFAICSAMGQSFIFYTLANFDSLTTTTVTTTRKVLSVLLSIFLNGHELNRNGWLGILIASVGILSELQDKMTREKGQEKEL